MELSPALKRFIEQQSWIFAKTYAKTWPHEYIVQERVDNDLYLALAHHIDTYGDEGKFYERKQIYFEYNGLTYWHMDNIINRCPAEDTFAEREKAGTLPEGFEE